MFRRRSDRARRESFSNLLQQAKEGDPDAITILYLNHIAMVSGYLRACRATDPDDLASEVFVGMLRGLQRFDGTQPEFRRWLMTIAHRRLVDQRRRTAYQRSEPTDPAMMERAAQRDPKESRPLHLDADLIGAFGDLSEAQREILALRFIADVSLREVAQITGRPLTAVKSLQNRGLRALRRNLSGRP